MSNCVVKHIVWGRGVINARSEKYIKVLFDDPAVGEKTFVYPDAFSKYITYEDKECQTEVEGELKLLIKYAEEQALKAEKDRLAVIAAVREKERNMVTMRKKAMAYSRKRAEKLKVKLDDKAKDPYEEPHDENYADGYEKDNDDGDDNERERNSDE